MTIQKTLEPIYAPQALLVFTGWPDAGRLAEYTISEIKKAFPCESAAQWDLEAFWHTESSRPHVEVSHGQIQYLEWPCYQFFLGRPPSRDPILIGMGPEPGCRWRTFVEQLLKTLKVWGCAEIYLLGSFFDHVFHDEMRFSSVVQDTRGVNHAHILGCELTEYTGPAAIHGPIMEAAWELEMYAMSLWAHMPFYLNSPHEAMIAQFLKMLGTVFRLDFRTRHLMERWKEREKEIEELIQQDPELRHMLESMDREHPSPRPPFPTSKVIRLDDFLKKRQEVESEDA